MGIGIGQLVGLAIAAAGLYKLWPRLRTLLPSLRSLLPGTSNTTSSGGDDFEAFEQLLARAERLESPEAIKCLNGLLVPLFGGKRGKAYTPEQVPPDQVPPDTGEPK